MKKILVFDAIVTISVAAILTVISISSMSLQADHTATLDSAAPASETYNVPTPDPCRSDFNLDDILDSTDEAIYRREFIEKFSNDNELLASFLLSTNALGEFVEIPTSDEEATIVQEAALVFSKDENLRKIAINRATELYAHVHIDSDWEGLRKASMRSASPAPLGPELASDLPEKYWDADTI